MPTVLDYTDPYLDTYTTVPAAGQGVCKVCRKPIPDGYRRCFSCNETRAQVTHPVDLVVPISLYRKHSQLHHVLRGYKDPEWRRITEDQRSEFEARVVSTLARFLSLHGDCIEAESGPWDVATTLPSVRPGQHPLATALSRVERLTEDLRVLLGPGPTPVRTREASDTGFTVVEDVSGLTVLMLDDTFTSGATVQSAGSALTGAGARVAGAVVVGRFVTVDGEYVTDDAWKDLSSRPFSFADCCLH